MELSRCDAEAVLSPESTSKKGPPDMLRGRGGTRVDSLRRAGLAGEGRDRQGMPLRDVGRHHAAHRRADARGTHVVRETVRPRSQGRRQGGNRHGLCPCGRNRAPLQAKRPEGRQGEEREGQDEGGQAGRRLHRGSRFRRQAVPAPGHHDLCRDDASTGEVHEAPPRGVRQALRQDAKARRLPVRRRQMAQERQAERIPLATFS